MSDLSFLNKEKLHTGFGQEIIGAKSYNEVLNQAGLDWTVNAFPTYTTYVDEDGNEEQVLIPNTNTIVRNEDRKPLGIVSNKYKIVNNEDAFAFTEALYNTKDIEFIRGGSYHGGSSTWLEARITGQYSVLGDDIDCYLIFMNSHDGTGSVKCMILPERIACSNALNVPLKNQSRHWRCVHSGDPMKKIDEAKSVLLAGTSYMDMLIKEIELLQSIKLTNKQVREFTNRLFPIKDDMSEDQKETMELKREQLLDVYTNKIDLYNFDSSGYRFLSAVADYVDHVEGRKTVNANLNRFMSIARGNDIVDNAYFMVLGAYSY